MRKRPTAAYSRLLALIVAALTLLPATAANGADQDDGNSKTAEPAAAHAAPMAVEIPADRTADSVMIMACSALALLMTIAVGLFYGGMVRRKNVLSAFQQAFILLGIVPLQWYLVGYTISFGPELVGGWLGSWQWCGLMGVGLEPNVELAPRIPHQLFMIFEMMVAVFTAALISGAIAERMRFVSFVVFILLWTTLVFDPVAHWVWSSGGWIKRMGALDFAGGLVVHLTSGLAALCAVWKVGKRKGLDTEDLHPHNLTLTALGTGLLWFCWLGLNAGGARGATTAAAAAVVATILAGSAAIVSWSAIEYFQKRKVTVLGACTGAIAGLVAVTPAAGYVTPTGALVLGILVCPFVYGAIVLKGRLGYDDSLDVFGVHGIGALVGVLALGVLATPSLTGGAGGLLDGNADLLFSQAIAIATVAAYTIVMTLLLLTILDRLIGLRVSVEDEELGLDLTQHGQRGYMMGEGELIGIVPK